MADERNEGGAERGLVPLHLTPSAGSKTVHTYQVTGGKPFAIQVRLGPPLRHIKRTVWSFFGTEEEAQQIEKHIRDQGCVVARQTTQRRTRVVHKFENPHVILPVVHVESLGQAIYNVGVARSSGADGVFIINHEMPHTRLAEIYKELRDIHPGWWIGVNCLDLSPFEVIRVVKDGVFPGADGIWVDDAQIHNANPVQTLAQANYDARDGWDGMYFGGVAFKYVHGPDFDAAGAASVAKDLLDVVVTSGSATGKAADLGKVEAMAGAATPTPLGVASGLDAQNVTAYLPFAKFLLVATGISESWTKFDPHKVAEFVEAVREWRSSPQSL